MTRLLALLGCVLLAASTAHAAESAAAVPVDALDQALVKSMHEGKATPFAQRYAALAPVIEQTFDLDAILATSVGPRWASFSPEQQAELRAEFLRFTVASYVNNFSSFGGEKFVTEPDTRAIGSEQVVSTRIVPSNGDPTRIDYVMRQGNAGWRAVDVLLDGSISRVAVQRSDFRSMLGTGGPEALMESLRKKTADLSGGASIP